ncbi:DUF817 domain-containing protein [Streptomyces sp. AS58]|uniref:DUF817 domain-containing protein n=1 Tax=Streptomyces sp. AS58 TaxID=1519489 RepID=UPI000A7A5CBE|nr:DUF817 domain-containing protein [Streptomyces sp. AS58]
MATSNTLRPWGSPLRQLLSFAWAQTRACAFAIALLSGVAVSAALPPLPLARYDLLVAYGVLLTTVFWLRGWESGRDVAVIAVCHVIGLAFELVKVSLDSWSYPEPAVLKFAGVPLYGGFLYAAVGSYVCRAWRLFDLELVGYRPRRTAAVAAAVYLNFFSHHWLPDARLPLAGLLLAATAGTWVRYTVLGVRRRMPLALSFALIGFFLWVAENLATYLGAWRYPYQLDGWQPVSIHKFGAWALLISVTFVLAAATRPAPRAAGECAGAAGPRHTGADGLAGR